MKNKLLLNTICLYILTIVKMVFPLITLPYLTRIFSVETYGYVAYVKSYMSYVQVLLDFGFLLSATKSITIAKEKDDKKIGCIVGDTFVEKVILLVFAMIIILISSIFIPILTINPLFLWLYFIAIAITIFLPDFLYRGIERMEYITLTYTASKIFTLIFTLIMIKDDSDLIMIPIFEIVSNLVAVLISFVFIKRLDISIKISNVKTWICDLRESGIYFLSNFSTTVFGVLTTIIVGILLNEADVAYWSVCMQIVSAAKSLYTPITNSIYPYMVKNRDIKLVIKIRNLMILPMILGSVVVMICGKQIMMVISGENYEYAGYILKFLLPVIIASFYSMLYGWPVLGVIGKVRQTTISTVIAALIQVVCILLIYLFGVFNLVSLAICCGISEIILLVIRYVIFYKNKNYFIQKS